MGKGMWIQRVLRVRWWFVGLSSSLKTSWSLSPKAESRWWRGRTVRRLSKSSVGHPTWSLSQRQSSCEAHPEAWDDDAACDAGGGDGADGACGAS